VVKKRRFHQKLQIPPPDILNPYDMLRSLLPHLAALLIIAPSLAAKSPLNVIYIKTDDQRYDSLSLTGHPVIKTPHIDQLALDGIFCNNAFITSPICGPSRANTFSGQWERKNRIGFHHVSNTPMTAETFDNSWLMQLKNAGYFTGYIGKHHVTIGKKSDRYMEKNIDFCYQKSGHLGFHLKKHKVFSNLKNDSQIEGLLEATEAFLSPKKENANFFKTAHASVKDFLNRRQTDKPFALSINFNLPHAASIGGMGSKKSDPDLYRTLYQDQLHLFPIPEDFPTHSSTHSSTHPNKSPEPLPAEVFQRKELMPYYRYNKKTLLKTKLQMARANTAIDHFVGSLRTQLEQLGLAENTLIIFASDHGLLLGEKGLGGKTFLYEDSIRIPAIIYSPHFSAQETSQDLQQLITGQDLPATILDLCGLPIPSTYQGQSLLPLISKNSQATQNWRTAVFCENLFTDQNYPRMEAIRSHDWKYIRYFSRKNDRNKYLPEASLNGEQPIHEELFHLKNDPKEQHNLATNPAHANTLKKYQQLCQEHLKALAN
jgi:arylsulfatase A-like enzyme